MRISADRVSGGFFLFFGLALLFFIIPRWVETAEDGSIAPETLPNIVAVLIALCGFLLILKPTAHQRPDGRFFRRAAAFVLALIAGIYAMSWFGFVPVAPLLALTIMLMIGESRPLWLLIGALCVPALIWLFVTQLLDRALP